MSARADDRYEPGGPAPGWRVFGAYLAVAMALVALAAWRTHVVAGGPGAPLDDAYIHLQYARSIAEGHAFRYAAPDEPRTSGATSVLYVFALALPWRLGLHAFGALALAQLLGAVGWALTALGMHRLGRVVHGARIGRIAGAVGLASGGLYWSACSGMETIHAVAITVWIFALAAEMTRDEFETQPRVLAALGFIAPFVRPELGALSLLAAAVLAACSRGRARWIAALPLAGVVAYPLFWLALTGSARTTGAVAKWLPYAPYHSVLQILALTVDAYSQTMLLGGAVGRATFLPVSRLFGALLTAGVLVACSTAARRHRTGLAWVLVGAALFPVAIATNAVFHWHRARYIWPAVAVLLVTAIALVASTADDLSAAARSRWPRFAGALRWTPAVLVLACAARMPAALADLTVCVRDIRQQQIALAMRCPQLLRPDARILVNDAGALAVFSGHRTVDVVGLTTAGLASSWDQGVGSALEAVEALPAWQRPTHAAVYRTWFDPGELARSVVASTTVRDSTVLGGQTLRLYELRDDLWNSGDRPLGALAPGERVADALDVARLASEGAHRYAASGADFAGNSFEVAGSVLDGGRTVNGERFVLHAAGSGEHARLVLRVHATAPVTLVIDCNGAPVGRTTLDATPSFTDVSVALGERCVTSERLIEIAAEQGRYQSFHAFLVLR